MMEYLQHFHFLRPLWLLAVPILLFMWLRIRPRKEIKNKSQEGIAPHLAKALSVGNSAVRKIYPIDGVVIGGICLALAVAGPTWSRTPNPLVAETAPLVVIMKVTESMLDSDIAPSRLDRARFKVLDLVAARAGARTALVAYAGTSHRVSPLTEDPNILQPLLESLAPEIMPETGDDAGAALNLAIEILATADTPGAILFVLDDLSPASISQLNEITDPPRPPLVFLTALPESKQIAQLQQIKDATIVAMTPDDRDIHQIERVLKSAHQAALLDDERLEWNDRAWWLVWPIVIIAAFWFRRGWTMRWAICLTVSMLYFQPSQARADGWIDWFLTADQQGRIAYERKEFEKAGELFVDPMWKGYAMYRAGQYEEAVSVFAALDTADAAFAQGMAEIRNRQYRPAVRSFEKALERQPDFPEAEKNREIAVAIVEYVETAREQSDTGEEAGIGADEIVFDNESGRGAETQIEATDEQSAPLTSEQWLQSIDTNMGDFLRSRFLLDNAGGSE